jgi:hypothetical protein
MRQSYTLQKQEWIKLTFSSSLKTSPSSLKTSPSSLKTSPSSSKTSSLLLRTLPRDILLIIFVRLDVISITAVEITCKYFKSMWESVPKPEVDIDVIVLKDIAVDWKLLRGFEYSLKYISQDLKLRFLLEFKLVVLEGKTESSLEYPTKALLIQDKNLGNDELQLLKSFVSKYSQTTILFWRENSFFQNSKILCQSLRTLHSLEYICINNGYLEESWPNFFNQFKRLKLVYFTPKEAYCVETIWTINTPKTVFIIYFVNIELLSGTLE